MERYEGWATITGNILTMKDKEAYGTLTTIGSSNIYYGNVEILLKNPTISVAGVRYKIIPFSAYSLNTMQEIDTVYTKTVNEIIALNQTLEGSLYYTRPFVVKESCVIRYCSGTDTRLTQTLILLVDKNIQTTKLVAISAEYKGQSVEMGETFSRDDLNVMGIYPNGSTARVANAGYIVDNGSDDNTLKDKILTVGSNVFTIRVEEKEDSQLINKFETTVVVPGIRKLSYITATYDGPEVAIGKSPSRKHVIVTAFYTDDTSSVVSDWIYEDSDITVTETNKGIFNVVYLSAKAQLVVPYYTVVTNQLSAYYNGPNVEVGASILEKYVKVKIHYSSKEGTNNVWEELPMGSYSIESLKVLYEGNNVFIVTYNDGKKNLSTTFMVYGIRPEKKLLSIQAEYRGPSITVGKAINVEKIFCRGYYSDNTVGIIKNFKVPNLIVTNVGQNELSVTFKELQCYFFVTGIAEESTTEDNTNDIALDLMYPEMSLVNHRYRGPMESYKFDTFHNNLVENLNELYNIFNNLETQKKELATSIQTRKSVGTLVLNDCNKINDSILYWGKEGANKHGLSD